MSAAGASRATAKRVVWLDFLRALACFLVIVNHTNSDVFKSVPIGGVTWYLSIAWYYLSKIAVPLFVMISGACLLGRKESYGRAALRALRVAIALVLFSYLYYLWGVWLTNWTWSRVFDIPGFLALIWARRITDSFWYLYLYIGLMLVLPLLQRMAQGMDRRDSRYLLCLTLGVGSAWPLLAHYVPALALPAYLDLPLFNVFIGLFFLGHHLRAYPAPKRWHIPAAAVALALLIAVSVWLTRVEAGRVAAGERYWFMDERTTPFLLTTLSAMAVFWLARAAFEGRGVKSARVWTELGGCAFGAYLMQDWLIAETRYRVFPALRALMPDMLATLLWELAIFMVAVLIALLLRRIPLLRKLL